MMLLPVWLLSPMFLPGGGSALEGGLHPAGGLHPEESSASGGGLHPESTPLEPEKRVVRILLKCFLVLQFFLPQTA